MTTQLIGSALDRVVNSKTFSRSRSLQELLTFLVTQSLASDQNLKEYRIGVDALKRDGAFDPAESSIVRVQAYRLRAKLADYYQHEGHGEDVRIDLEPGSYTAVIRDCAILTAPQTLRFPGLRLDILPFERFSATSWHHLAPAEAAFLFCSVVAAHLDRVARIALRHRSASRACRAHLQLEFRPRTDRGGMRVIAFVCDADSRAVVWSGAVTKPRHLAVPELERAGIVFGQEIWERIAAVIPSSNG